MADVAAGLRTESPDRINRTAAWLRSLAVATFAGFLCGMVALGIGSRLAMRIVALLASDADQGTLTDAQAIVGDITVGGTIFLTLLGGAVGAVGGLLYLAIHRRLAWAGRWRGVAFGALLLAIFGSTLIESSNPDFDGLGIPIVNVAIFAALFVSFGVLIAPVYDNLQRAVAAPSRTSTGYLLFAAQAAGMLLSLPATLLVIAVLLAGASDRGLIALAIPAFFVYVLVALPIASTMPRFRPALPPADPRAALATVMPLAPPVAIGIALDVRELLAIF